MKGWGPTVQSVKSQSIFQNMVQLVHFFFMILLYPRLEEERQVLCVCLSVRPPPVTKYFRLIFLRNYWCQTLHIWCAASASGPTPRLPNFTLVQYSPLNRFPTLKKNSLNIGNGFKLWSILGCTGPSRVFPTEFTQENPEKLRLFSEQKKLGLKYNF